MKQPNSGEKGVDKEQQKIESIVARVKSGDTRAYTVIIQTFEKKIYTYCYCILKKREEAEDAAQEIFIKVYQEIERYENRLDACNENESAVPCKGKRPFASGSAF